MNDYYTNHFSKHFGEKFFLGKFLRSIEEHIIKARKKHPKFLPSGEIAHWRPEWLAAELAHLQIANPEKVSLQHILTEEMYEFLLALQCDDKEAALSEACDVVAVLYRALVGDIKEAQ